MKALGFVLKNREGNIEEFRENTMNGNIVSSRSPFQKLRLSPWRRRGMNEEKASVENTMDSKYPLYDQERSAEMKGLRPRSTFRTLRPISIATNGTGVSPWKRHTKQNPTKTEEGMKIKLHKTETDIFQQLCLEKQDENPAIEILLDSVESKIPEIYTASSANSKHGSCAISKDKASSIEGKRKFLDRLFFRSPRKPVSSSGLTTDFLDSFKENNFAWSHSSNTIDGPNIPSPPSSVPRTRISVEDVTPKYKTNVENSFQATTNSPWAMPMKYSVESKEKKTRAILDDLSEGLDAFSNISTLSGTKASSLTTPMTFDRHESLGLESIKDIRKCLKEMERQLGQASHKGHKVSRQKVMRALFTVADSLEDNEEKSYLKKELNTVMKAGRDEAAQLVGTKSLKLASSDDDRSELTTSDDEEFTLDSCAFKEDKNENIDIDINESPFNIVSSVGNFFGVNVVDQQAVEEVLDDLLWTEFVTSRQKESLNTTSQLSTRQSQSTHSMESRNLGDDQDSRTRSWWRNRYSKEEDDESSTSSEQEFSSYLPTSIIVKKQYIKKPTKFEHICSNSNSNYKVKLVETESRQGYEMDSNSRRSKIM